MNAPKIRFIYISRRLLDPLLLFAHSILYYKNSPPLIKFDKKITTFMSIKLGVLQGSARGPYILLLVIIFFDIFNSVKKYEK